MFGMFSIDAAEGMLNQKNQNDTRRVEIAKAFEQYRRDNPYATALDLQNFTDSLVGSDFYLRPGNATGQALQNIADTNEENRLIADRKKKLEALNQEQGFVQQVDDFFVNRFKASGDSEGALRETQELFGSNLPGDPSMDSQIKKVLDSLSKRADSLANNTVYQLLGENQEMIKNFVEQGMDQSTLQKSLPAGLQGQTANSLLDGQIRGYDRGIRDRVFGEAANYLKDDKLRGAVGMNDLSLVREKVGPDFYDRYNKDGELDEYLITMSNAMGQDTWNKEQGAAFKDALEYGDSSTSQRLEAQTMAFAHFAGGDSPKDIAIQGALGTLQAGYVLDPTSIRIVQGILERTTANNSEDILAEIDAALPPGSKVPVSQFKQNQQNSYLSLRGLGGGSPQTFPDYVRMNLGENGAITKQTDSNIDATTPLQIQTTAELYGGTNAFGLPTADAYAQHVRDISVAIRDQQMAFQELEGVRRNISNQSKFLATVKGQDGDPGNQRELEAKASRELDAMQQNIKANIENLGSRQDELRAFQARVSQRNRRFNDKFKDFDGNEIKEAAKAMQKYMDRTGKTDKQNIARQYAAALGVVGGVMVKGRNRNFSRDQLQLAEAILRALP